ncbi:hypothetical protein TWF281_011907 [Arthrobotrys megalospora]
MKLEDDVISSSEPLQCNRWLRDLIHAACCPVRHFPVDAKSKLKAKVCCFGGFWSASNSQGLRRVNHHPPRHSPHSCSLDHEPQLLEMSGIDPKTTSLITEHLTFTPLEVVDDIINAANESVYGTVQQLENYLRSSGPSALGYVADGSIAETDEDGKELFDDVAMNEIQQGLHMLEMLMESKVDKAYDQFEVYVLRNIFSVPPEIRDWMRLRHHDNVNLIKATSINPEKDVTPESLAQTRRQLQETTALHRFLKADVSRNDKVLRSLRTLLNPTSSDDSPLAFLLNPNSAANGIKSLGEDTEFAAVQVKELRRVVAELKKQAIDVFGEDGENAMDLDAPALGGLREKQWNRALYVEKMSRRHLEKARGLSLTEEGALKGASDLLGIKKSETEVATLEEVLGKIPEDPK